MPSTNEETAQKPSPPARVPNRNRHMLARIRRRTLRKRRNVVVDATVDMQSDIDAINRGEGTRSGRLWTIGGRTYHIEPSGHSWPVSGPGVYPLGREAFLALGIYNEHGLSRSAERLLDLEHVSETARAEARRAWQAGMDTP
jgi:hypothetical protein